MNSNQQHSSELALIGLLTSVAATLTYKKVWSLRWKRGKDMRRPLGFALDLLVVFWFLLGYLLLLANHGASEKESPFLAAVVGGVLAFPVAWFFWIIAMLVWEGLVRLNSSERQRNSHVRTRELSLAEVQARKRAAEEHLQRYAPAAAAGAVWGIVERDRFLAAGAVGTAAYGLWQPYKKWCSIEQHVLNGGKYREEVPPRDPWDEFHALGGPWVRAWALLLLGITVLGIETTHGINGGGRIACASITAVVLALCYRRRIARAALRRANRKDARV